MITVRIEGTRFSLGIRLGREPDDEHHPQGDVYATTERASEYPQDAAELDSRGMPSGKSGYR